MTKTMQSSAGSGGLVVLGQISVLSKSSPLGSISDSGFQRKYPWTSEPNPTPHPDPDPNEELPEPLKE